MDDDYTAKIHQLWKWNLISDDEFMASTSPTQRDQLVMNDLRSGEISIDDPQYARYYDARVSTPAGHFDVRDLDYETRRRFGWTDEDPDEYVYEYDYE